MNRAELLAPVGKMENAIAAIENGADALFVGGKGFNARQYADNFTEDELQQIVHYAKLRGVRVYVTVNVLVKQEESEALFNYLKYLETIGVHAIIIQDLGVAAMVKKHFPKLRMHASTQMSAHSVEDVMFLKELGFKRVVLARELQLKEIKEIVETCDIEIETFVHGAMCYSYSGQCLMSSLIGGRSGNRGRCAQPCRMKYTLLEDNETLTKEAYLLSLKDICSVEFLPELVACGIHSFKIEGRMKSPEYVASVVGTYRKYLDLAKQKAPYKVEAIDLDLLKGVYNRGGFSKGYYYQKSSKDMLTADSPRHIGVKAGVVTHFAPKTKMATITLERDVHPGDGLEVIRKGKESVGLGISKDYTSGMTIKHAFDRYVEVGSEVFLTKNHSLLKSLRGTYQKAKKKLPIQMKITGRVGEPIEILLTHDNKSVTYKGMPLESATNAPLTADKAEKQFGKLGSTSFYATDIEMDWDENGYLPVSSLNEIRRLAISELEETLLEVEIDEVSEEYPMPMLEAKQEKVWRAHVTTMEQLKVCMNYPELKGIYWEWKYEDEVAEQALELCLKYGKDFYLALPYVMKEKMYHTYREDLKAWSETALTGYLVRNYGEYYLLKDTGKKIVVDYNLNVMNNESIELLETRGVSLVTQSVELVGEEMDNLQGDLERIVYGTIPVMTSSQCILGNTKHCQKGSKEKKCYQVKDRKDMIWRIQTDCKACHMQILSHEPLVMKNVELKKAGEKASLRLHFTHETNEETEAVLDAYLKNKELNKVIKGTAFKTIL